MTLPRPVSRAHPLYRLPDCAIQWAHDQLAREDPPSRRDLAAQLQVNRRTLDRRLERLEVTRIGTRIYCCRICGGKSLTPEHAEHAA